MFELQLDLQEKEINCKNYSCSPKTYASENICGKDIYNILNSKGTNVSRTFFCISTTVAIHPNAKLYS